MERISLEESNVLSLFPNLDRDTSRILFYLMKNEEKSGEVLLVKIMENCFTEGTEGMYQVQSLLKFFEKKINLLDELRFGKDEKKVFTKIKLNFPKVEWMFSEEYYREAVL